MEDPMNVEDLQILDLHEKERKEKYCHHYEGIYLPVLWNAPPVTRSPLVIGYHNGLFHAIIVSEGKSTLLVARGHYRVFSYRHPIMAKPSPKGVGLK